MKRIEKIISLLLCFLLCFEQSGIAQVAGQIDISGYIGGLRSSFLQDKFRPLHLRYLSYDNQSNSFKLLLDKGDFLNGLQFSVTKSPDGKRLVTGDIILKETKKLMEYFFIGLSLPNESFWVNLRPDSQENIIDEHLAQTEIGRILLEADVQLKKDTARWTSPETKEGKEYWNKLYKRAEELLGYENISIPTLTRPWIVPKEIIIRETPTNAYVYKATLKVMLEEDYLKSPVSMSPSHQNNAVGTGHDLSVNYEFKDERLKELNTYSTQLINELIIPKLTKEVNTAKRYAPLRQVYYSLILAQWFKQRFYGKGGLYSWLINQKNLTGLTSKVPWSKTSYFQEYQKSFKDGEYNIKEPIRTPFGQSVRSYFSGGVAFQGIPEIASAGNVPGSTKRDIPKEVVIGAKTPLFSAEAGGGSIEDPGAINLTIEMPSAEENQEGKQQIRAEERVSSVGVLVEYDKVDLHLSRFPEFIQSDLLSVGPSKPVGYLPLDTIGPESLQKQISDWAHSKGLKVKVIRDGSVSPGALYVYDEAALTKIIQKNTGILRKAGVPLNPGDFIDYIGHEFVGDTEAYKVIALAFADESFKNDPRFPGNQRDINKDVEGISLKVSLHTDLALAEKGIKAYRELWRSLPLWLKLKLMFFRATLIISAVYTGVTPEVYIVEGVNEQERIILTAAIERNDNFKVFVNDEGKFSIVNLEAISRVIAANSGYFPSDIQNDKQKLIAYLQDFFANHRLNYQDREKIYGLFSGFPVSAVEKFPLRRNAVKKLKVILNDPVNQARFSFNERRALLNAGRTGWGFRLYSPQQRQGILKQIAGDSLNGKEIAILMNEHTVTNNTITFIGFDKNADRWAKKLWQIHASAANKTMISKLLSWIETKLRTMLYWITGDFGQAEISEAAFILSNLQRLFDRQGITGVSDWQMEDLAQYIYERQIAAGGGAAVELEEKVVREIFGNSLPAEVIKKILGMGDVGMGGLPVNQSVSAGKSFRGRVLLFIFAGILALSPFLISCAQIKRIPALDSIGISGEINRSSTISDVNSLKEQALKESSLRTAKKALSEIENILKTPGLEFSVYEAAVSAIRNVIYERPNIISTATVLALESIFRKDGLDTLYESIGSTISMIIKMHLNVNQKVTLSVLADMIRGRHGVGFFTYRAAANAIGNIALYGKSQRIRSSAVTALENLLITAGLDSLAYVGVADTISDIIKSNPQLISAGTILKIENILHDKYLDFRAHMSAGRVILSIVQHRSELITSAALASLENLLKKDGTPVACCEALSVAIKLIADKRPDLIKSGSLASVIITLPETVCQFPLPHYQLYFNNYFLEKTSAEKISPEIRYSIGLCIYRFLGRRGLKITDDNIKKAVDFVNQKKSVRSQRIILGPGIDVVSIVNTEDIFYYDGINSLAKNTGSNLIAATKGTNNIEKVLEAIGESKGELRIILNGHGDMEYVRLEEGEGGIIRFEQLGDALIKRGNLDKVVIINHSCYSYDFIEGNVFVDGLYGYLRSKGIKVFPDVITSNNLNQKSNAIGLLSFLIEFQAAVGGVVRFSDILSIERGQFSDDPAVIIYVDPKEINDLFPQGDTGVDSSGPFKLEVPLLPDGVIEIGGLGRGAEQMEKFAGLDSASQPIPPGMGGIGFQADIFKEIFEQVNQRKPDEITLSKKQREVLLWGLLDSNRPEHSQIIAVLSKLSAANIEALRQDAAHWAIPRQRMAEVLGEAIGQAEQSKLDMGKCVTGDTLLPVISGNGQIPRIKNRQANSEIELKPIVEVKAGDYVLSLNEASQQIEPHRINGLLDMGVKPVYKLTTVSGRSIRTTANHPYLVKVEGKRQERKEDLKSVSRNPFPVTQTWIKVSELKAGDEIAVVLDNLSRTAGSDNCNFVSPHDYQGILKTSKHFSFCQGGQAFNESIWIKRIYAQDNNSFMCPQREPIKTSEISIQGKNNSLFFPAERDNFFITGIFQSHFNSFNNIVTLSTQEFYAASEETMVSKKLHLSNLLERNFFVSEDTSCVMDTCPNISRGKFRITLFDDFFNGQSLLNKLQDHIDRDTCAFNTRFTKADFRVNRDSLSQGILSHYFHLHLKLYHKLIVASSFLLDYVLGRNAYAQTDLETDILWDKIVSIEYVGNEQVYDIEVEGTHNFIGNGIFAHNTYIREKPLISKQQLFSSAKASFLPALSFKNFLRVTLPVMWLILLPFCSPLSEITMQDIDSFTRAVIEGCIDQLEEFSTREFIEGLKRFEVKASPYDTRKTIFSVIEYCNDMELLRSLLTTEGLSNTIYYSVADRLLAIAFDEHFPNDIRKQALHNFKKYYKTAVSYMTLSSGEKSSEVMKIVYKSIDLIGTDIVEESIKEIETKYHRKPQRILFYLCMPDVVYPLLFANKKINRFGNQVSLGYLIGVAFAEGYNKYGTNLIRDSRTIFKIFEPMGLDRFGKVMENLRQKGYLPKDYDGFRYDNHGPILNESGESFYEGAFITPKDALVALAALLLQDRDNYLAAVKRFGDNPDTLTEEQIRVGTYLWYCTANPGRFYSSDLVGKIGNGQHGNGLFNAQWPAATAELIEKLYGSVLIVDNSPVESLSRIRGKGIGNIFHNIAEFLKMRGVVIRNQQMAAITKLSEYIYEIQQDAGGIMDVELDEEVVRGIIGGRLSKEIIKEIIGMGNIGNQSQNSEGIQLHLSEGQLGKLRRGIRDIVVNRGQSPIECIAELIETLEGIPENAPLVLAFRDLKQLGDNISDEDIERIIKKYKLNDAEQIALALVVQPGQGGGNRKEIDEKLGQCVTGDTMLPVIRRDVQGAGCGVQGLTQHIQYIPITNVQPGDYVLSLNEATQQIESHRINGLLDMGVKPVYKLTTASGRSIRTTANHPYLVKVEGERQEKKEDLKPVTQTWIKVSGLKAGDEIAVVLDNLSRTAGSDNCNFVSPHDYQGILKTSKHFSFCQGGQAFNESIWIKRIYAQDNNSFMCPQREPIKTSEISIQGKNNSLFFPAERDNFFITGIFQSHFNSFNNIVTLSTQEFYAASEETMVSKKLHLSNLLERNFFVSEDTSCVMDTCPNISRGKFRITLFDDFFNGQSLLNKLQDHIDRDTCAFNTGFTKADFRVNRDSLFQGILSHCFHLHLKLYHKLIVASSFLLDYVFGRNAYAQTDLETDILWDKIVSIEYAGNEQVYDIEVQGTHNFIGNGIFAHNTYIQQETENSSQETEPVSEGSPVNLNGFDQESSMTTGKADVRPQAGGELISSPIKRTVSKKDISPAANKFKKGMLARAMRAGGMLFEAMLVGGILVGAMLLTIDYGPVVHFARECTYVLLRQKVNFATSGYYDDELELKDNMKTLGRYLWDKYVIKNPNTIPIGEFYRGLQVYKADLPRPPNRTAPNILRIYLKLDPLDSLPVSQYKPQSLNDGLKVTYRSIAPWSRVVGFESSTSSPDFNQGLIGSQYAWPTSLLKRLLTMQKGDILYFRNKYPSEGQGNILFHTRVGLGSFLQSFGKDEQGPFLSISDIWDFKGGEGGYYADNDHEPAFLRMQLAGMNLIGEGIYIYDRFYLSISEIEEELKRRDKEFLQIERETRKIWVNFIREEKEYFTNLSANESVTMREAWDWGMAKLIQRFIEIYLCYCRNYEHERNLNSRSPSLYEALRRIAEKETEIKEGSIIKSASPEPIDEVNPGDYVLSLNEETQVENQPQNSEDIQLHLNEGQLGNFRQGIRDIVVDRGESPIRCIEELIETLEGISENAPLVLALRELKQLGDNITDEDIDKIIEKHGLNDEEQVALVLVIQPGQGGGNRKEIDEKLGQCVTGDTMLPVILGNGQIPRIKNRQANSEIELKSIVEVKAGDYVLSLNEASQQIEPCRINGLLDMGVKPVYKLTTALGRSIRTTANHPYLVKVEGKRQERKEDLKPISRNPFPVAQTWIKVSELKTGDEIAVVNNLNNIEQQRFYSLYSGDWESSQLFTDQELIHRDDFTYFDQGWFGKVGHRDFFFGEQIFFRQDSFRNLGGNSHNDNIIMGVVENRRGDNYCGSLFERRKIGKRKGDEDNISLVKGCHRYYPLDYSRSQKNFALFLEGAGHLEGFLRDGGNPQEAFFVPQLLTKRFPFLLFPAYVYTSSSPDKTEYNISILSLSSIFYVGEAEAAEVNSDILWDKIVSIEYAGNEQVYDIEVQGTHNFIGNGIFAHNTYIQGSSQKPVTNEQEKNEEDLSAGSLIKNPTFKELSATDAWLTTRDGRKIWLVGKVEGSGKQLKIESVAKDIRRELILDSSKGYNIVAIEGVEKDQGVAKLFVLKHEIDLPMMFRYQDMQKYYNLRDNGKRSKLARELLSLLLQDPQFSNYEIRVPEVQIVEVENKDNIKERLIATEYINKEEYGRVAVLDSKPLGGLDRSSEIAEKVNHAFLDVFFGMLLYQEDREYLVAGGAGEEKLVPFDFDTVFAPLYYYKNGFDHGYNASGFLLKGEAQEYTAIAREIGNCVLRNKDKIMKMIGEIWESEIEDKKVVLGKDELLNVTPEIIWDFLEAQASRVEDVVRVVLNDRTVENREIYKEATEKMMWGSRLPADLRFILHAQRNLSDEGSPADQNVEHPKAIPPGMGGIGLDEKVFQEIEAKVNDANSGETSLDRREREVLLWGVLDRESPQRARIIEVLGKLSQADIEALRQDAAHWAIPGQRMAEVLEEAIGQAEKAKGHSTGKQSDMGQELDKNSSKLAQRSEEIRKHCNKIKQIIEKNNLLGEVEYHLKMLNLKPINKIKQPLKRLFALFNGVAKIVKEACGHDFDLAVYPASGSDISAGFSYARHLVTIDGSDLFKIIGGYNDEELIRHRITSNIEMKLLYGMHGLGQEQDLENYAVELILLGADLDSLNVVEEDGIKIVVEFQINGETFRHSHYRYHIKDKFQPDNEQDEFFEKEMIGLMQDKNVVLLSKGGGENIYGLHKSANVFFALLPAGSIVVTDLINKGREDSELEDLKTPVIIGQLRELQGEVTEEVYLNTPYLKYGYATNLANGLGIFRKKGENISQKADSPDLNASREQATNPAVSADELTPGGIDFRNLPVAGQPLLKTSPSAIGQSMTSGELDNELQQIEKLVNAGIIPSMDRIIQYLQHCQKGDFNGGMGKVLSCLADILRLEEERLEPADSSIRDILTLVESEAPVNEFQLALSKIIISAKEPMRIGQ